MEILIGRVYKHYKGNYYIVMDIATHSETGEKMVIYKGLYENGPVFARPYNLFIEEVNKNNQKHRFELQNIESKAR